jgi:uncharacterized membrane protein YhaH (DUF805 family)
MNGPRGSRRGGGVLESILRWTRWRGRLRRRTFWWRLTAATLAFVVLFVFLERTTGHASTLLLYPPVFAVLLSLAVRRLHDQARTGWWLLASLVPVLGPLLVGWLLLFARGTRGDNQYDADPRLAGRDYLQVAIHEPA